MNLGPLLSIVLFALVFIGVAAGSAATVAASRSHPSALIYVKHFFTLNILYKNTMFETL